MQCDILANLRDLLLSTPRPAFITDLHTASTHIYVQMIGFVLSIGRADPNSPSLPTHLPGLQLATARPKLVVRPAQPAVEAEGDAAGRPARPGGLEGLAASLRIGRQQVLELLLEKFYDKR